MAKPSEMYPLPLRYVPLQPTGHVFEMIDGVMQVRGKTRVGEANRGQTLFWGKHSLPNAFNLTALCDFLEPHSNPISLNSVNPNSLFIIVARPLLLRACPTTMLGRHGVKLR